MTPQEKESNRKQLLDCLNQLAERALELDESHISICINSICGAIAGNDDDQFSYMCEAFARIKLNQAMKEEEMLNKLMNSIKNEPS